MTPLVYLCECGKHPVALPQRFPFDHLTLAEIDERDALAAVFWQRRLDRAESQRYNTLLARTYRP